MPGKTCGVCEVQLKPSDGKNKLRAAKLWPKLEKLALFRNTVYDKENYICEKCRWPLTKLKLPTNPEAARMFQFLVDPINKISKRPNNLKGRINQKKQVIQEVEPELVDADELEISESETSASVSSESVQASTSTSNSQNTESSQIESTSSIQANTNIYNIASCSISQRYCLICKQTSGRTTISAKARVDVFLKRKIIIPEGNRSCVAHLKSNGCFKEEALINIVAKSEFTRMTPEDMSEFLLNISILQSNSKSTLDFDNEDYSEEEFKMLTGLSKQNFEKLFRIVEPYLRDSKNRPIRNALALFFVKLRLNLPQVVLALLFGFPNQERVSENFSSVMEVLHDHFVPMYLGYKHMSRIEAKKNHQAPLATGLHSIPENALAFVLDGTYLPCEKPSSFPDQKLLWSEQKHCTLVKPMMITMTDGYITDMPKCFPGKWNDAKILNTILEWQDSLLSFAQKGDSLILDRGFRDSAGPLRAKEVNIITPPSLDKGQQQFTTAQANKMRLVTMARFVVEVVNGRIKMKFKFFNDIIKASYLPKIHKLFRIACAVMNAFASPIISNPEDSEYIMQSTFERNLNSNHLSEAIQQEGLENRRVIWEAASQSTIESFPVLTMEDMKKITLGTYQTSLATRYIRQHVSSSGDYQIYVHKERNNLLRAKIQSRFRGSAFHQLWIQFTPGVNGHESIIGYCCKCKVGERTVGTCSHVASVIYYLGYCRYNIQNLPNVRDLVANIINNLD